MSKSKIFKIIGVGFLGGIASASFCYPQNIENFWFFLGLSGLVILFFLFYKQRNFWPWIFSGGLFIFGASLTDYYLERIAGDYSKQKNFQGAVIILEEPKRREKYQQLIAEDREKRTNGKILILASLHVDYTYGEILKLDCQLERPKNFSPDFDYQMYLARDGIFYLCKNQKIEKGEENDGNYLYRKILTVKNKIKNNISRLVPAPESGLLLGLLLGGDDDLSASVKNSFSQTGMTHIVAVSGYNVTIVAEYMMLGGIFLGLWRRQAFYLAVFGILLFVIMTGYPSSAIRAGVMGTLLLWAMKNGRLGNSGNAIFAAAAVMLLFNPLLLRWDIGFQLSFLATLGIIHIYPIFDNWFIQSQEKSGKGIFSSVRQLILETLFLTLSAQAFVLPIIIYNFGTLSLISPLANILVLPIIPLTMFLGFITILGSLIFSPLATVFSWLVFLPLRYETIIISYLANWKFSAVELPKFSWIFVLLWYIILVRLIYFYRAKLAK